MEYRSPGNSRVISSCLMRLYICERAKITFLATMRARVDYGQVMGGGQKTRSYDDRETTLQVIRQGHSLRRGQARCLDTCLGGHKEDRLARMESNTLHLVQGNS